MRKHFLESLEREIDYNREYRKLEEMVINERVYRYNPYIRESINMWLRDILDTGKKEIALHLFRN